MKPDVMSAVRRHPLFATLNIADLRRILDEAEVADFPAGAALFSAHEPACRFFVIVSGRVELFVETPAGCRGIIDLLGPGGSLGEESLLGQGTHAVSARALEPVTAVAIDAVPFLRHLEDRFDLVQGMLASLSVRLRGLVREISEIKLKSTAERLGGFLLMQVTEERGSVTVRLPYDKRLLAEKLGMRPESLSRAFAKLRAQGVHTIGHDTVAIDAVEVLHEFCDHNALE